MRCKTSVVIVSYNNFDITTGPCLDSLLVNGEQREFEIIVVDNASSDKTPEMLKKIAVEYDRVKVILNKTNRGFAGGNNDGVSAASGDVIILLNSDTLVPAGSMEKLSALLLKNREWGLLSPSTNEAGNEQKIYTQGRDPRSILEQGVSWCLHSNEDWFESERLDFFCVGMKKRLYEDLGGLDEIFGLGYYEDTDFSIKAAQKKIKMIYTEDVFVYHQAGKSFSKHGRKAVKKLMKTNKKILIRKHGNTFKLHHIRDRNLMVLKGYTERIGIKKEDADYRKNLLYKFERRIKLAKTFYPNNPLKKMKYRFALKKIKKKFTENVKTIYG